VPRVTRIAVNGLRILDNVELSLAPLNVLIGENGSGKSSLVEACEILRLAATSRRFVEDLYRHHAGGALFRTRPGKLTLSIAIDEGARTVEYSFTLELEHSGNVRVVNERLKANESPLAVIERDRSGAFMTEPTTGLRREVPIASDALLLGLFQGAVTGSTYPIERTRELLANILVYLPLDTSAMWARREGDSGRGPRSTVIIRPAVAVDRGADNLPNAYHTLRNQGPAVWDRVLDLVRLGLGDDVVDVLLPTDPGGGQIGMALRIRDVGEVSSRFLSDGQLAYLTFVAILHLQPETCPLVVFDEPDHHLHPDLVRRVVGIFQELSEDRTVLITTHSDRLLDLVADPAGAVVLLSAPEHRTIAKRPDPDALAAWLKDYRGIGELRADGVASMVFPSEH
jgi:predicted ATPase